MTTILNLEGSIAEVCESAYQQSGMALGDVVVLGAFEEYEVHTAAPSGFERVPLMLDDWERLRLRFSELDAPDAASE